MTFAIDGRLKSSSLYKRFTVAENGAMYDISLCEFKDRYAYVVRIRSTVCWTLGRKDDYIEMDIALGKIPKQKSLN